MGQKPKQIKEFIVNRQKSNGEAKAFSIRLLRGCYEDETGEVAPRNVSVKARNTPPSSARCMLDR